MLQVPSIYIVKLRQVLVVGYDEANRTNGRLACPEEQNIVLFQLSDESSDIPTFESSIRLTGLPRPRVAGANQRNAVIHELVGVTPISRTTRYLPYRVFVHVLVINLSPRHRQQHSVKETFFQTPSRIESRERVGKP